MKLKFSRARSPRGRTTSLRITGPFRWKCWPQVTFGRWPPFTFSFFFHLCLLIFPGKSQSAFPFKQFLWLFQGQTPTIAYQLLPTRQAFPNIFTSVLLFPRAVITGSASYVSTSQDPYTPSSCWPQVCPPYRPTRTTWRDVSREQKTLLHTRSASVTVSMSLCCGVCSNKLLPMLTVSEGRDSSLIWMLTGAWFSHMVYFILPACCWP